MKVIVSFVDRYIVVDGEARHVPTLTEHDLGGMRGLSWDGTTGHCWFDALAGREPFFFDSEDEVKEFVWLWEAYPPEELPLEYTFEAIPATYQQTDPALLPPPDSAPPPPPNPIEVPFCEGPEIEVDQLSLPLSTDPPPPPEEYDFPVWVPDPLPELPQPPLEEGP